MPPPPDSQPPDPPGSTPERPADPPPPGPLDPATPQEVAGALAYALRFDERGRPRPGGWEFAAALAAEALTEHLGRSGFVVLKRRPAPPHST